MKASSNTISAAQLTGFQTHRWICLISGMIICICAGFGYAWSVLQSPISTAYGWTGGQVSLAYTLTVVCAALVSPLFGRLIRKLGIRKCIALGAVLFGGGMLFTGFMDSLWQLYLCYGVIAGFGGGFIYPCMMAYVIRLFPDRSGMASGLGTAAYGSGAILWAPVAVGLTNAFSISAAFRFLGAVFLVVILAGSLLLREPPDGFREMMCPETAEAPVGDSSDLNRGQMICTSGFYLLVAVFTCGLVAGVIVISQASPILQQAYELPAAQAALLVSAFSACNMAGRFLWGSLSDRLGISATGAVVLMMCTLSMLALALIENTAAAVCAMGIAASCYGGFASVLTPLTAQMFGSRYITENYGLVYVVFALASFIGPVLAVQFQAWSGGYSGAFLTAAMLSLAGFVLSRFLKPKSRQGGKN